MGLVMVDKGVEEILRDMDMSAVEYEECRQMVERLDKIVVDSRVVVPYE